MKNKGISLIALIITIAVLIIIAGATIQNGMQRADNAKLAEHNINISTLQEEVENYYHFKGGELPVVNLTTYPIPEGSELEREIIKNSEQADKFYVLDLIMMGKTAGKEGNGLGDDFYIVSATRHTVYYVKGNTIKSITYHGLISKNDVKLAQITGGASPTPTPGSYAYNNPKIPNGFNYVGTETWDTGFTIQDSNGNQFVWVPVGNLPADGTLDGTNFNSKFGRRNFRGDTFGLSYFYETNDTALQNMTTSVNTYGGFYIAKYEMSDNGSGMAQSKEDKAPWTNITWDAAKTAAEDMDADWDTSVESYLCYSAHWDTALKWLMVDTGSGNHKTLAQIKDDSTTWGNYNNATFTYGVGSTTKAANSSIKINTGVSTNPANRHMAKGIYDLAGNVWEWTMESYDSTYRVYRGGYYNYDGYYYTAADRATSNPAYAGTNLSFRTTIYLK